MPGSGQQPVAWQPFTPRGVANFASATFGRLFLVQFLLAILIAAAVLWFLTTTWFPVLREAITALPTQGRIVSGELQWPRQPFEVLVERRPFLAFTVDLTNQSQGNSGVDLTVRFCKNDFEICSPLGRLTFPYDKRYEIQFNQPEVEPWWGAWQPILLGWGALGIIFLLLASWTFLATLYFLPAWLLGFYTNRQLTCGGSWRLASAALMPGALICLLAIVAYGLGVLDLFHLLFAWALHVLVGWLFLVAAVLQVPRLPLPKNPFTTPVADSDALAEAIASENPFVTPPDPSSPEKKSDPPP
jgi:hypothetical protein